MLDLLGFLYPFRSISAIWVEICERGNLESLPFSTDLRCLGRDFQPATTGISTLLAGLRCLGREIRPAATGISTFLYDFRCLGRDLRTAALGISTLSPILCYLGRDLRLGELGISTLFDGFQYSLATETYSCSLKLILPYFTISYSKIGILLIAHIMEIRINYP